MGVKIKSYIRSGIYFILSFFFLSASAQAVVFDMGKEKFGSYLRSTFLPSWSGAADPFQQSSGTNMSFNNQFTNLSSYEFGFLFNSGVVTWRVGFEMIQPAALSGVSGSNASNGTLYYTLNSQISSYMPKLGMEFNLKTWHESRLWLYGEYGYATLTVQNSYNFTAAGTTQFGIPNFSETVTGIQSNYAASLGFETLLTDTSTVSFEAGYRMLNFGSMNESTAVTNFQGAQAKGAQALTNSGSPRNINLSGAFAAINLRIWVY